MISGNDKVLLIIIGMLLVWGLTDTYLEKRFDCTPPLPYTITEQAK